MKWDDCRAAFEIDGSLRDIYFHDTTMAEWDKFLDFVRDGDLGARYTRDDVAEELPLRAETVVGDPSCSHSLKVNLGGVIIISHFYSDEEIELDIDPREVKSQRELDLVLNFMRTLGTYLSRDAILTEENAPQYAWFKYSFKDDRINFVTPHLC